MNTNPVLPFIKNLLRQQPVGLAEHHLIRHLSELPDDCFQWPFEEKPASVFLYKKHFLVMNALYQLRPQFAQEGQALTISALDIHLCPPTPQPDQPIAEPSSTHSLLDTPDHALSIFYLDWQHYEEANEATVESLMTSFWLKMDSFQRKDGAYEALGLDSSAGRAHIEKRYRQLASQHHPDKGGNPTEFIKIRQAYESLIQIVA